MLSRSATTLAKRGPPPCRSGSSVCHFSSFFSSAFSQPTTNTQVVTSSTAFTNANNHSLSVGGGGGSTASASTSTNGASSSSSPSSSTQATMTRRDVIEEVATTHELTLAKAERIVATVLDTIMEGVSEGKSVQLSKFGTIEAFLSKARTGRNPQTGEAIDIPEKSRIRFRPFKHFKDTVQKVDG